MIGISRYPRSLWTEKYYNKAFSGPQYYMYVLITAIAKIAQARVATQESGRYGLGAVQNSPLRPELMAVSGPCSACMYTV